jgi:glycogen operon protein
MRPEFYTGRGGNYNAIPDISWFDEKGPVPDWEKVGYFLALRVDGRKAETLADRDDNDFYLMFNSGQEIHPFKLSELKKKEWFRVVDTGLNPPNDILPVGYEKSLPSQHTYPVKGRSMAILISKDISNG